MWPRSEIPFGNRLHGTFSLSPANWPARYQSSTAPTVSAFMHDTFSLDGTHSDRDKSLCSLDVIRAWRNMIAGAAYNQTCARFAFVSFVSAVGSEWLWWRKNMAYGIITTAGMRMNNAGPGWLIMVLTYLSISMVFSRWRRLRANVPACRSGLNACVATDQNDWMLCRKTVFATIGMAVFDAPVSAYLWHDFHARLHKVPKRLCALRCGMNAFLNLSE